MGARKSTSKKRSGASSSPQPPNPALTFFLDRDLGRYDVAQALRALGANVEIHSDHFAHDTEDVEWLLEIGKRGWVLLSKDRHILTRPLEIITFLRANIHAFILLQNRNDNLTGEQMGAAFIAAHSQMLGLVHSHSAPMIARVTPTGHVCKIEGYSAIQLRALRARDKR